ncbi:Sorting Nexin-5 [Manis pentadactyla]|nr:Sorting Nexin-5 [Manis pentadactyla]
MHPPENRIRAEGLAWGRPGAEDQPEPLIPPGRWRRQQQRPRLRAQPSLRCQLSEARRGERNELKFSALSKTQLKNRKQPGLSLEQLHALCSTSKSPALPPLVYPSTAGV